MSGLKLFHTMNGGVTEVTPRLAAVEADVQSLIEAHMETMLGVRLLESEYVIDCVDGGRIDSLGIDENGAPVIVEYKRGTDAGVINQGLYYLSWLTRHRSAFGGLVRDKLGVSTAAQVLWSAPRLICVAGDFSRYDAHAVREHRRSIDLVRYRYYGSDQIGLETVVSATGKSGAVNRRSRHTPLDAPQALQRQTGAMEELAVAVDEALRGLGGGVTRVQRKQYAAYQRLRNFACVIPPQQTKLLVYLKADPKSVDLRPGFTRDVTGLGHHGTGDLEVQLRTERDLERAQDLFRLSYAAA
ncbi:MULTISPECIES: endonuclease NucS domain-containing protein [Streptomyces]|uniref:endonuclease NucS domain-containing protein n=1 Tax=Streptomyces TaxID=1883 RepID=UPI0006AD261B|nr:MULTISPECIES: endonuclease NucS domain-containing protein [Streptomyces]ALC27035.1 transporter [Streptomyces sp. CFMR 7]RZF09338.1 DUF91 domain-containing protein [Streptomyces albidoflavus]